jgi:hypothetical protein
MRRAAAGAVYRRRPAIAAIAAGRTVVLLDDTGPAAEGELVIAAQKATTELVAFMVRHGSGFLCVPLPADECKRLALPPMQTVWEHGRAPAYTVTVDARTGIGTGISAADRATTLRVLADASTRADDLARPGHVVSQHTQDGGVRPVPAGLRPPWTWYAPRGCVPPPRAAPSSAQLTPPRWPPRTNCAASPPATGWSSSHLPSSSSGGANKKTMFVAEPTLP